jgi:hypothetical protein
LTVGWIFPCDHLESPEPVIRTVVSQSAEDEGKCRLSHRHYSLVSGVHDLALDEGKGPGFVLPLLGKAGEG